jgi:RNA polymerase sigma-70 factor (ECF subfamily)
MSDRSTTHATLLARLATGTDEAWSEFASRYGTLIRGFARRRGLSESDCDDVLQETLLALSKSMPSFKYDPSKGLFRSYLKTVVVHVVCRKSFQKAAPGHLEDVDAMTRTALGDSAVEQSWESQWRQYHLERAMRTIATEFNEQDISAFEQYAVGGVDPANVGSLLGISIDQVYQAKSRITKRLSQLIAAQIQDEG